MPWLTWDQWLEWRARYDQQPWGEQRQDLRQAVSIAANLVPFVHMPFPSITWPYFEEWDNAVDVAAAEAAIADHKAKYGLT